MPIARVARELSRRPTRDARFIGHHASPALRVSISTLSTALTRAADVQRFGTASYFPATVTATNIAQLMAPCPAARARALRPRRCEREQAARRQEVERIQPADTGTVRVRRGQLTEPADEDAPYGMQLLIAAARGGARRACGRTPAARGGAIRGRLGAAVVHPRCREPSAE